MWYISEFKLNAIQFPQSNFKITMEHGIDKLLALSVTTTREFIVHIIWPTNTQTVGMTHANSSNQWNNWCVCLCMRLDFPLYICASNAFVMFLCVCIVFYVCTFFMPTADASQTATPFPTPVRVEQFRNGWCNYNCNGAKILNCSYVLPHVGRLLMVTKNT